METNGVIHKASPNFRLHNVDMYRESAWSFFFSSVRELLGLRERLFIYLLSGMIDSENIVL